jgi:spermidine synthase
MKPWKTLATSHAPGGALLTLQQRDVEYAIRVDGQTLMSSRATGSERAMAEAACASRTPRRILIGGLGMGFTLRAVLDLVPAEAHVTVAELSPAVIEWNQGVLAPLAGSPLEDPRVQVIPKDVRKVYKSGPFDAILLDVDNGPTAMTADSNDSLYDDHGLALARAALHPKGVFIVWSAGPDQRFVKRLENSGFTATTQTIRRHTLFIARAD